MEKETKVKNPMRNFLILGGIVLGVTVAFRYLLFILLPLGLGWILAYYLQKPIGWMHRRLHLPAKLASGILVALTLSLVLGCVGLAAVKLWEEAEGVGQGIARAWNGLMELLGTLMDKMEGFLDYGEGSLKEKLPEITVGVMEQAASKLPGMVAGIAAAIPQTVIGVVVFALSAFYLSRDFYSVNRRVLKCFDKKTSRLISEFKNQFLITAANYFKAYLFILVLSFTQLYFGLTVLRVDYAFSVALIIALIDILPVVGMGIVVIPWGIWCALTGDYSFAAGLFILFGVMSVIRQIVEPKVVGDFIGLHPLVSLLAVCVGLKVMGVLGMILFPILLIILKKLVDSGHLCFGEKNDP